MTRTLRLFQGLLDLIALLVRFVVDNSQLTNVERIRRVYLLRNS